MAQICLACRTALADPSLKNRCCCPLHLACRCQSGAVGRKVPSPSDHRSTMCTDVTARRVVASLLLFVALLVDAELALRSTA